MNLTQVLHLIWHLTFLPIVWTVGLSRKSFVKSRSMLPHVVPMIWLNRKCCVFQPAFGCCAHSKAGQNTFFSRIQLFFFISKFFSDFFWNQVFTLIRLQYYGYGNTVKRKNGLQLYGVFSIYSLKINVHTSCYSV